VCGQGCKRHSQKRRGTKKAAVFFCWGGKLRVEKGGRREVKKYPGKKKPASKAGSKKKQEWVNEGRGQGDFKVFGGRIRKGGGQGGRITNKRLICGEKEKKRGTGVIEEKMNIPEMGGGGGERKRGGGGT